MNIKVGIMQPYFFPYMGYWQLINVVDKYIVYDDVQYIKGGWINRNLIRNGVDSVFFNVNMVGASSNKLICDIEVNKDVFWRKKNIKMLENIYSKAPFFKEGIELISNILYDDTVMLSKFLYNSICSICNYLDISTGIVLSSQINKNSELKGQDKVIDICKNMCASEYYNAVGGMDLYRYEDFKKENIELCFLSMDKNICYMKSDNTPDKSLSIIDWIMYNDREYIIKMLNRYTIIREYN